MGAFRPILAGATLRDRMIACLGALVGIGLTGVVTRLMIGDAVPALLIGASLGASAVLLFAVPASPLAQPWPVIGGSVISTLTGIAVHHLKLDPMVAGGVAVAGAIGLMSLARCLHPPGGGAALAMVVAGPQVTTAGWLFALVPVGVNALLLVAVGWVFHRLVSKHSYPHRPAAPQPRALDITTADVDRALEQFGEPLDVNREDLRTLTALIAAEAARRS